ELSFPAPDPIVLREERTRNPCRGELAIRPRRLELALDPRSIAGNRFALGARGVFQIVERLTSDLHLTMILGDAPNERVKLGFFLDQDLPRLFYLRHGRSCLAHPLHDLEVREVTLLALLVLREPSLELTLLLLVGFRRRLGAVDRVVRRLALAIEVLKT